MKETSAQTKLNRARERADCLFFSQGGRPYQGGIIGRVCAGKLDWGLMGGFEKKRADTLWDVWGSKR